MILILRWPCSTTACVRGGYVEDGDQREQVLHGVDELAAVEGVGVCVVVEHEGLFVEVGVFYDQALDQARLGLGLRFGEFPHLRRDRVRAAAEHVEELVQEVQPRVDRQDQLDHEGLVAVEGPLQLAQQLARLLVFRGPLLLRPLFPVLGESRALGLLPLQADDPG